VKSEKDAMKNLVGNMTHAARPKISPTPKATNGTRVPARAKCAFAATPCISNWVRIGGTKATARTSPCSGGMLGQNTA
jgi:hypothetical protein